MENEAAPHEDAVVPAAEDTCAHCGQPLTVNPYKTPLCTTCRQHYVRFPIPVWIKAFSGVILLLVLYGLISFPKHVETGIHYRRAQKAAENQRYVTAQKELAIVVAREPEYLDAQCQLLIAAFHNYDMQILANAFEKLKDKKIDDDALFNELTRDIELAGSYFPGDSFNAFLEVKGVPMDSLPQSELTAYVAGHPEDLFARTQLASLLQDANETALADSLLNEVLNTEPEYAPALMIKPSIKRELMQFDSSYYYADKLIADNKENGFALSAKVRTLLKQKRDDEAMQLAQINYRQDPHDLYTMATLALAYHFKGDAQHRDALLAEAAKDSTSIRQLAYVKDVISGKEPFRN